MPEIPHNEIIQHKQSSKRSWGPLLFINEEFKAFFFYYLYKLVDYLMAIILSFHHSNFKVLMTHQLRNKTRSGS